MGDVIKFPNKILENHVKTVQDVFNTLTDEQKEVVYYMIGCALEDYKHEIGNDHS